MQNTTRKYKLQLACRILGIPIPKGFRAYTPVIGKHARTLLRSYQEHQKIPSTGRFDPITLRDLELVAGRPGAQALEHAKAWIGTLEETPNRGKLIDTMKQNLNGYIDREPWCADFVSFMFLLAGYDLRKGNLFNWRYCPSWKSAAQNGLQIYCRPAVRITRATRVQPGTVVLFDWDGDNVPDHIGFIEKDYGLVKRTIMTPIQTVEGNTSGDAGQGVHRKWHTNSSINMFVEVTKV
jgi:CHAP domain